MSQVALIALIVTVLVGAALPPALKQRSWKRFFIALFLAAFGILLPLFIFWLSSFLTPEWKGGCRFGWFDCFHRGKLALTSVVLWACAAFYAVEVYRVADRTRPWLVLGFFLGALVSSICFLFGVVSVGIGRGELLWWLSIPLYVAVWYSIRALQLSKPAGLRPIAYLMAVLGSVPFWVWSLIWSRRAYLALPDKPPTCFVVTAAARGHRTLVGPFVEVWRDGSRTQANRQLLTLWQFETIWRARAKRSHMIFRRCYNRLGPLIARHIRSPWLADLTYLALKPIEVLAGLIVLVDGTSTARGDKADLPIEL